MKFIALLALFLGSTTFASDVYQDVYGKVDQTQLQKLLKDMTGYNPVTVKGETYSITDRYLATSKAKYRNYWMNYFSQLGMNPVELSYDTTNQEGETLGHNMEAVLPGKSADSIIIIVHYDSLGPQGPDNPAVDDDMTGMAILMETARILNQYKGKLQHTVRFVAVDQEELGQLEGSRNYAKYITKLAADQGFKLVSAIDDEQSGWKEDEGDIFDVFSCGGDTNSDFLGDLLAQTATTYGKMRTKRGCMGENSDHYAMWEAGIPAVVYSEHDPFNNPHFDREGGDVYDLIDQAYYFSIAQVGVTFSARVVGIDQ